MKKSLKNVIIDFLFGGSTFTKLISISFGIALFDQLFKESIDEEPDEDFPREMPHTGGAVTLHKKRNDGFALGFMNEYPALVKLVPVGITAFLAGRLQIISGMKGRCLEKSGLALCIGGAISNITDRLMRGYVVDYICIRKGALKKIIVNIGDIAIFAGGIIAAAGSLIGSKK